MILLLLSFCPLGASFFLTCLYFGILGRFVGAWIGIGTIWGTVLGVVIGVAITIADALNY